MDKPPGKPVRLMLVEGRAYVRNQIRALLRDEPMFELAAEFESGAQSVQEALNLKPDLILMDLSLPDSNGLEMTHAIKSLLPGSHVLLMIQAPIYRQAALASGASEILMKSDLPSHLIPSLKRLCALVPNHLETSHSKLHAAKARESAGGENDPTDSGR
ncbi:MAG: response regulator transcription factor [Chloroflexi bacterium]|nr:response regulator transcription factor [Chloroflexota bacterium]